MWRPLVEAPCAKDCLADERPDFVCSSAEVTLSSDFAPLTRETKLKRSIQSAMNKEIQIRLHFWLFTNARMDTSERPA